MYRLRNVASNAGKRLAFSAASANSFNCRNFPSAKFDAYQFFELNISAFFVVSYRQTIFSGVGFRMKSSISVLNRSASPAACVLMISDNGSSCAPPEVSSASNS